MSLDTIESFLVDHGGTPLPGNIARILAEWAEKRESLVIRNRVTPTVTPRGVAFHDDTSVARTLDERVTLLPAMSSDQEMPAFSEWQILDHHKHMPKSWTVDERGRIRLENTD